MFSFKKVKKIFITFTELIKNFLIWFKTLIQNISYAFAICFLTVFVLPVILSLEWVKNFFAKSVTLIKKILAIIKKVFIKYKPLIKKNFIKLKLLIKKVFIKYKPLIKKVFIKFKLLIKKILTHSKNIIKILFIKCKTLAWIKKQFIRFVKNIKKKFLKLKLFFNIINKHLNLFKDDFNKNFKIFIKIKLFFKNVILKLNIFFSILIKTIKNFYKDFDNNFKIINNFKIKWNFFINYLKTIKTLKKVVNSIKLLSGILCTILCCMEYLPWFDWSPVWFILYTWSISSLWFYSFFIYIYIILLYELHMDKNWVPNYSEKYFRMWFWIPIIFDIFFCILCLILIYYSYKASHQEYIWPRRKFNPHRLRWWVFELNLNSVSIWKYFLHVYIFTPWLPLDMVLRQFGINIGATLLFLVHLIDVSRCLFLLTSKPFFVYLIILIILFFVVTICSLILIHFLLVMFLEILNSLYYKYIHIIYLFFKDIFLYFYLKNGLRDIILTVFIQLHKELPEHDYYLKKWIHWTNKFTQKWNYKFSLWQFICAYLIINILIFALILLGAFISWDWTYFGM